MNHIDKQIKILESILNEESNQDFLHRLKQDLITLETLCTDALKILHNENFSDVYPTLEKITHVSRNIGREI